tara:strand:+ start:2027 stop:2356 length:330 start_codon:yes stop_codon:yes gene_type:complete
MFNVIKSAIKDLSQGKPLKLRSSHWEATRSLFLKTNPSCAACGGISKLQVHHKQPFHLFPALELDPSNLITLCEEQTKCHLDIGHLGNWKSFNPLVVEQASNALLKAKK